MQDPAPPPSVVRPLGIEQRRVRIVPIPLQQALVPKWCNDNNNAEADWTYGHTLSKAEYQQYSEYSMRKCWAHLQSSQGVIEFFLNPQDVRTLHEACQSGVQTGRRPMAYAEELSALEARLPVLSGRYFIRLDQCSPKDSIHKAGPLTQRAEIVDCLCTSMRLAREYAREASQKEGLMLYVISWRDEWAKWVEFRCFCFRGRLSAVSQYAWPRDVGLGAWGDEVLVRCVANIVRFCEGEVAPRLSDKTGGHWVIDVILPRETLAPEFVEVNPFGAELSSGSALFNWVRDRAVLYGDGTEVEFRYVCPSPS